MENILRNPDDVPAGGAPPPPPSPNPPIPADPIAARIVIDGKTQLELNLEKELEAERETRKAREVRLSVLEDELSRLKNPGPPTPRAKKKRAPMTFFEQEDAE